MIQLYFIIWFRSLADAMSDSSYITHRNTLTFDADLFLATPSLALQHGLNPHEALKHVSSLFSSYQAELIRLREVLADFTTETIEVEEFEREWRVMKEVDRGVEKDLGELNDVLSAWGAVDSEMN